MKLNLCIVFNHGIAISDEEVLVPKSEAEFVLRLAQHFDRVAIAGFLGERKNGFTSNYDGVIFGRKISVFPLGRLERFVHTNHFCSKAMRYADSLPRILLLLKKFDFLYIFVPGHIGFIVSVLCMGFKKPYGVYVRGDWGTYPSLLKLIHLQAVKRANFAIVTGPAFANRLRLLQPRIETVFPMLAFSPNDVKIRRDYSLGSPINLLFVGSIVKEKGVFDLLYAIKHLNLGLRTNKRYHLILVGTGPGLIIEECLRLTRDLGISNYVTFVGHVSNPRVLRRYFEKADFFVFPSYAEGFPRVIYEAMLSGLPVIATELPGTHGVLIPSKTFVPVLPNNPLDIARKVKILTDDESLRVKVGSNGRRLVRCVLGGMPAQSHAEQVILNIRRTILSSKGFRL